MKKTTVLLIIYLCICMSLMAESKFGELTEAVLKIIEAGTYHMKTTVIAIEKQDMEYFKKGKNAAILTSMQGTPIRIVFRADMSYFIVDSEKLMITAPVNENTKSPLIDTEKMNFVETGQAKFDGKKLSYDEYMLEDIKIQIFINKDKLAGIKTFISDKETQDMVVLEFDKRVPSFVFDIPPGYTVRERDSLNFD